MSRKKFLKELKGLLDNHILQMAYLLEKPEPTLYTPTPTQVSHVNKTKNKQEDETLRWYDPLPDTNYRPFPFRQ